MFNNLHHYAGFEDVNLDDFTQNIDQTLWVNIQNAIWFILGDISDPNVDFATNAIANGTGYTPLPGGWAVVVFYVEDGGVQIQLMPLDP